MISFESGESEVLKPQGSTSFRTCFIDQLPNNLLNVLDARDLRSLAGAGILRVLVITREVRSDTPLIVLSMGGSYGKRRWGSLRLLCPLILYGLRLLKYLDLNDELILNAVVASL